MVAVLAFIGGRVAYNKLDTLHENVLLMENVEALTLPEAIVGRTPTPGQTICIIYYGDSLVSGRVSVCEQAAPLNKSCVPGICMIPNR